MTLPRGAAIATLLLAIAPHAFCQQSDVIRTGTQEVLLDLVVRDKHQKMMRDLRARDVQVFEDGVPQEIRSFEFIRTKGSGLLNAPGAKAPNRFDPLHELNVIAMVFQAMSNESRANAGILARDFLRNQFPPNTLVGAFAINRRLYLLQPFTDRPELLNGAVDTITKANYTWFARISAENLGSFHASNGVAGDDPTSPALDSSRPQSGGNAVPSNWQSIRLGDASERGPQTDGVVANLQGSIEKMQMMILRHAEGMYSTQTLLALIRVLAAIPGRKTVLFFSEGLSINVVDNSYLLKQVVNEANRANVSFYTVNTNGLQTLGSSAQAQASIDWLPLRELAESTGGFSMENSNDLRAPLQRVVEDATSHYEIFYQPKSQNFDGRFRRIEVRVNRPGAILQTREGYYALPMLAGQMLQASEIQCLKALDEVPRPRAFQFRREAIRFNDIGGQAQYQLVVEIPSSVPRLTMQSDGKLLTGGISVLALVKDQSGNVIDKLSRSPGLQVAPSNLERFQQVPLTFTLPVAVPPGQFSVEIAVVDPSSHRASTEVLPLTAAPATSPEVSDIVLVGALQKSQASGENPLSFADQRVTPSLQRSFSAEKLKDLPIFFAVHRRAGDDVPEVRLELRRDGRLLAAVIPAAQAGDTPEEMPYLATIPIARLAKGVYDVVVEARSGTRRNERKVQFELE
jgi:VWFA-related protein